MAPTTILADQHYRNVLRTFFPSGTWKSPLAGPGPPAGRRHARR